MKKIIEEKYDGLININIIFIYSVYEATMILFLKVHHFGYVNIAIFSNSHRVYSLSLRVDLNKMQRFIHTVNRRYVCSEYLYTWHV